MMYAALLLNCPFFISVLESLQDLLNHSTEKAGLCVICCCTSPRNGKRIVNCTAPQRMAKCFGEDLGFSVVLKTDISIEEMNTLMMDLENLKIPTSFSENFRFIFYFFGHGNEDEICLKDGNFSRKDIIKELQKINQSLCKVVIFDSCRNRRANVNPVSDEQDGFELNVQPVQETEREEYSERVIGKLGSGWEKCGAYPETINTLIIYSTDERSEAYYETGNQLEGMRGCGLMTFYLTELAPKLNQPLSVVLTEVRAKVDEHIKDYAPHNPSQVLVFEHRLMRNINLLAESRGKGIH